MFNRKSSYALNKKDPNAIVYMDANDTIIRLTYKDFASEEEFLKWKSWSDRNYHTEDNRDVVEGKHNMSIDDLSEAALSIPAIDVVMERQHEKSERRRMASAMVSQIRDKLTEPEPEPEPEKESGSGGALVLILLLAVLGGGAFAYIKFIKPKQGAKVSADPDDYEFEDEEYENEDIPEQGDFK